MSGRLETWLKQHWVLRQQRQQLANSTSLMKELHLPDSGGHSFHPVWINCWQTHRFKCSLARLLQKFLWCNTTTTQESYYCVYKHTHTPRDMCKRGSWAKCACVNHTNPPARNYHLQRLINLKAHDTLNTYNTSAVMFFTLKNLGRFRSWFQYWFWMLKTVQCGSKTKLC